MPATVLDGRAVAAEVRAEVARAVAALARPPGLATVLVGDDPASEVYVRNKRRLCVEAGMADLHRHLPADVHQSALEALVDELAADTAVTGILVQLPDHLDPDRVLARIPPGKDVDGLTTTSAGRLAQGRPGLRPCTPAGVLRLLDRHDIPVAGTEAVVVGRSVLVGRPQAQLLLSRDATVTTCHSATRDLVGKCRQADLLVVAAGQPGLVGPEMVKPGAVVVDIGIHRTADGLCGDVRTAEVAEIASAITPVPGGVGPMTIAMLLYNTLTAATVVDHTAAAGAGS
ncbi:bifunctional methylenetetrahydrofolate dehydrogenase/methenyltetrahydrofolate cyclohydrolase FolD [Pseudonocardia sp. NPDC046786]|uniref:bifunctional methylenetetrahydrofolate dehydrogenase/methenyltetrahydrofolate cyclohydrolase FolD n=1 Tax=Pseudonocardia sp. NPDC046786 TaxID=3155471 RepID=UPI0033C8EB8E